MKHYIMKCEHCGAAVADNLKRCVHCGCTNDFTAPKNRTEAAEILLLAGTSQK